MWQANKQFWNLGPTTIWHNMKSANFLISKITPPYCTLQSTVLYIIVWQMFELMCLKWLWHRPDGFSKLIIAELMNRQLFAVPSSPPPPAVYVPPQAYIIKKYNNTLPHNCLLTHSVCCTVHKILVNVIQYIH